MRLNHGQKSALGGRPPFSSMAGALPENDESTFCPRFVKGFFPFN